MSEAPAAPRYEPIAVSAESTVVAEFVPDARADDGVPVRGGARAAFIELLQSQAYEYLRDHDRGRSSSPTCARSSRR